MDRKTIVNHGNSFIEEFFSFTGEGWEQIRNGGEKANNGAGNNNGI